MLSDEEGLDSILPDGAEILDVMMSVFSGVKDEFGKEELPPSPLTFDRVCGGPSPQSTASLFKLPTELMDGILQHVPSDSLAPLALVNRDCLQWARSRQFASIHLDYGQPSLDLIQRLLDEVSGLDSSTSSIMPLPRLGLCIRRITVATNPGWIEYRHGVELSEEFNELSKETRSKLMVDASSAFYGKYIPSIQRILDPVVLPHLELLDWKDKIPLPQSFFETLATSHIKYLKIFRVALNKQFDIATQLPSASRRWPLRTLHLELTRNCQTSKTISGSPLCASILRLCSATLENLSLSSLDFRDPYTFTTSTVSALPRFPNLRRLSIGILHIDDSSMLQGLVGDGLRYLEVGRRWQAIYSDFFENRGTIPNLDTFIWNGITPQEPPYSFLHANPQISMLALPSSLPSTTLDTKIVPLLENFRNLTSLRLVWAEKSISESALQGLCTLKTLKQVCLSAGTQIGWRHDWLIDHGCLRRCLRTLPCLERLALSRDSYNSALGTEMYYSEAEHLTASQSRKWERRHRQRMLDEANTYARVIPRLEWIYLGQIPMGIVKGDQTGSKRVRVLFQERDDLWTFLRKMFEGHT
ncbi:MAG: hypothetical protein HETSPECPRED_005792 [Heterodermia speciosa]|uniref:F-box domain-containing protein n=1 Tax=Heterodermia speciosa TaxID=116794 RepID=A0A8H3ILG5_9LECA|nr:MAG: hypothetical protein HETSPECPRED_005792 [Heterodermia speciosa]